MRSDVHMRQCFSSHVDSIGYDSAAQELHVQYKSGGTRYVYKDVSPDKAHDVMSGASIGGMLHKHIKGQHDHETR